MLGGGEKKAPLGGPVWFEPDLACRRGEEPQSHGSKRWIQKPQPVLPPVQPRSDATSWTESEYSVIAARQNRFYRVALPATSR